MRMQQHMLYSNIQLHITYSVVHVANTYHYGYVLLRAWEAAPSPYDVNDRMDIEQVQDSQMSLCERLASTYDF